MEPYRAHRPLAAFVSLVTLAAVALPGIATAVGVSIVSQDGAWSWFSDPRAFYADETVYAGWVTMRGDIQVGSYSILDGRTTIVDLEEQFGLDDHDYPAFFETSDGRYTAFYSGHAAPGTHNLYRTSVNPWDITSWSERDSTDVNTFGSAGVTYSNPYAVPGENDRIFLFWRGGNWRPAYATGTYDPLTKEWSWLLQGTLISVLSGRPYVKYVSGHDKIGFAFTDGHPKETDNNIYYAAIAKDSCGQDAFFRADGALIKHLADGPLTVDEADTVFNHLADPETTGDNSWVWDIAFDDAGLPVVVFVTFPSVAHHQYHWAAYDGMDWYDTIIVENAGGSVADTTIQYPQYYYSGGIAVDPVDPGIVYVSTENGAGGWDLDKMATGDLGWSWETTPVVDGALVDNMRPVVPRDRPENTEMVLWMSGRYDFYKSAIPSRGTAETDSFNYDTAVMLWTNPVSTWVPEDVVASGLRLYPNSPNPFRSSTEIAYALAARERVSLRIYDASGRAVRTVADGPMPAGRHSAVWDGRDEFGNRVASGVYFVKLDAGARTETRRAVLIR